MTISRRSPGDKLRIRASEWNDIGDAVDAVSRLRGVIVGSAKRSAGDGDALVLNSTGATVPLGGVLFLSDTVIDPADNEDEFALNVAMVGIKPTIATMGRVGIAREPIADGQFGRCAVAGAVAARVSVTDENIHFARAITNDSTRLVTSTCGMIPILWLEDGAESERWALVMVGGHADGVRTIWAASATQVSGTAPPRYKYAVKGTSEDRTTGDISQDAALDLGYAYNSFENSAKWGNGQSLSPGASATLTPSAVEGPVPAYFTGLFDPGDGKPIWRFHAQNPMQSECGSVLDSGSLTQAQVENITGGV